MTEQQQMLEELKMEIGARAEFWRTNQEDAHGISMAVYVALSEVRSAIKLVLDKRRGK